MYALMLKMSDKETINRDAMVRPQKMDQSSGDGKDMTFHF